MGLFGFLGDIGKGIAKGVGGALKGVAPLASFIPGVGSLAGAGAGLLGKGLSALGGIGDQPQGTPLSEFGGAMSPRTYEQIIGGQAADSGGGGLLGKIGGFLDKNAGNIIGAGGALASAGQMNEALKQLREAQGRAQEDYAMRAPLREGAMAKLGPGGALEQLLANQPGFKASAFVNPQNPFARSVADAPAPTQSPTPQGGGGTPTESTLSGTGVLAKAMEQMGTFGQTGGGTAASPLQRKLGSMGIFGQTGGGTAASPLQRKLGPNVAPPSSGTAASPLRRALEKAEKARN
jgi:hypothetical protein